MRMMIAILALLGTGCDGQNVTRPVVEDIEINYESPSWGSNDLIVFDHVPLDSTGKSDYEQVGLYMINSDGTGFAVLALRRDLPGGIQVASTCHVGPLMANGSHYAAFLTSRSTSCRQQHLTW